ncbi:hypothetical protein ACQPW3_25835 [Actinosynnema sp. CA-248983]
MSGVGVLVFIEAVDNQHQGLTPDPAGVGGGVEQPQQVCFPSRVGDRRSGYGQQRHQLLEDVVDKRRPAALPGQPRRHEERHHPCTRRRVQHEPGHQRRLAHEQNRSPATLLRDDLTHLLAAQLAGHLLANQDIQVRVNGDRVNPAELIEGEPIDLTLDDVPASDLDGSSSFAPTTVVTSCSSGT